LTTNKHISDILPRTPTGKTSVSQIANKKSAHHVSIGYRVICRHSRRGPDERHCIRDPTCRGSAAADADKAAAKDATAKCRAQVKEQARFEEMSLYARHKLVKKCVKDTLAGH
jgi:hypothetical protein